MIFTRLFRKAVLARPLKTAFYLLTLKQKSMDEIWKDIKGYEGFYQVSNLGRVRSLDCVIIRVNGRTMTRKGALISHKINTQGYPTVRLHIKGKYQNIPLHRLIAEAFIPNPENKPCVDHINTIRIDYSIDNLRWVTYKENSNNPITHKRNKQNSSSKEAIAKKLSTLVRNKAKNAPRKVYQFSKDGTFIAEHESASEAGRKLNIYCGHISSACNRYAHQITAGGFLWSYNKNEVPEYKPCKKNMRPINQYDKEGNLIKRWDSVKSILKQFNISRYYLLPCLQKKVEVHDGFRWEYDEKQPT